MSTPASLHHRLTRGAAALAAAVLALGLAACGSGEDDAVASETATVAPDRTVKTEFGEVTIPGSPKAALGFYTTDVDALITLGIPLAKSQPIRGDSGYTTFPTFFPQEALAGVTPFANYPEYDYEGVLAAEPDLILNGLGYDEDTVKRLPDIAATYSYNAFDGSDWRVKFKQVATDLGREKEYQAWTDSYDAKVAEVKAKIAAAGLDPVVAPVSYWDGKVSVGCYGVPCLVFKDLGLDISPLATASADGTSLSSEELDKLQGIDYAFESVDITGNSTLKTEKALVDNKAFQQVAFVKDGHIVNYEMEMDYGSPSGQLAFLDVVAKALVP